MTRSNFMNYCTACNFTTDNDEVMELHVTSHRLYGRGDHKALPVRAGSANNPECHHHKCPGCEVVWDCDDPSCTGPNELDCDKCFRKRLRHDAPA